ncbi:MAG: hypothetical protein KJO40_11755 [Deltaproteobacteria bacterium]|nr:hypothetical protein [Deltaproteobacteria bacterium]NNK06855.1 hypothetical protein [Myxococcales bacterium]MBT8463829.1 hypothetical protein [Deltaproteobacteria bacterium]MBT8481104.1 hypothetical protein [Deltaproteobacteria bacterium]NNK44698.1 hypothetical protein [Myxococcales bacterium]
MERQHWLCLGGFAAVAVAASAAATWVGLSGSWVGDDWHMVHNYLYGDWAELGAVFRRNAASYLFVEDKVGPYRPATMLTLIATHLLAPEPWLHHAVSWALHAATSLLLFAALRGQASKASNVEAASSNIAAAGLAALFFVHPVNVESYVWINGRSDLFAGFWLVALVFWLSQTSRAQRPRWVQLVVLGLVAFLGASSKLPFAIAAVAAWLAWASRRPAAASRWAGSAIAGGIGVHLVLRAVFAPFRGQLGASENVFADPEIWAAVPKLVGKGAAALLSFRAEAMQSLSWVLFGPWSMADGLGLALVLLVLAFLVLRRDGPGLAYAVGAILTLAPVAIVSGAFWMGFDRYLYMPSILALLATAPYVSRAVSRGREWRFALGVLALGLLGYAASQTHAASRAYASQEAYDRALLRDHADDPSIHFYFARIAARHDDEVRLRERLSAMPSPPWPRPIIVPTYDLATKARDAGKRREAVDAWVATVRDGPRCARVRIQLETWAQRSADAETAAQIEERLDELACVP